MPDSVTSEDFSLTPSIKDKVQESVDYLKEHFGQKCGISVFLKKISDHSYRVIFRVRMKNKELLGTETGPDLYTAIGQAKAHAFRAINDFKKKKVSKRKKIKGDSLEEPLQL